MGVLPPDFRLPPFNVQVWIPLVFAPDTLEARGRNNLWLVGRLADGVSTEAAQDEATAIARRLAETYPLSNQGEDIILRPLHSVAVGDAGKTLTLLLGSVGILLLIACVNVTNLTLARGIARERELSVRVSLGAGRLRLITQILGVDDAAAATDIGVRHLRRRFRRKAGIGPKTLSSIFRFQRFLTLSSGQNGVPPSHAAYLAGYHDQSHMARDFRCFA